MRARTVLIAIDSPVIREGLTAMLATVEGLRVVAEADTDAQALECARRHRPYLALIDPELSNCAGWQTIHTICRERLAHVVVALGRRADENLARLAGAQAYIQVGTSPRELVRTLETALALDGSTAEAEQDLLADADPVLEEPALVDL